MLGFYRTGLYMLGWTLNGPSPETFLFVFPPTAMNCLCHIKCVFREAILHDAPKKLSAWLRFFFRYTSVLRTYIHMLWRCVCVQTECTVKHMHEQHLHQTVCLIRRVGGRTKRRTWEIVYSTMYRLKLERNQHRADTRTDTDTTHT